MRGYYKYILPKPKLGKRYSTCERCNNKWTDEVELYYNNEITIICDYCDNCITEEEKNES